jgi:hypothetical protein
MRCSKSLVWKGCLTLVGLAASSVFAQGLPSKANPGPDADFPPFVSERNGVFQYPWGAANYRWPEQLFWEDMSQIRDKHLEMLQSTAGQEANGLVPVLSTVAWGYEYGAASGGDSLAGLQDMSREEGWRQYGSWLTARKAKYFAQDWDGKIVYPHAGYVTPLMPLDKEDWPEGIDSATFGDFSGRKLGLLANQIQARGIFAADFVVGLYGGNHDFHPRVIADFERRSGVKLSGTTVRQKADDIVANHWSRWNDFKAHGFAKFYARIAETIRSSGREPQVGGQILPSVAQVRGSANDFRIYLEHLPARNWFFQVELQSDEGRMVPSYWTSSSQMGTHAARAPDFPLGAHMDAYQSNFWNSVRDNNKKDPEWGVKYLKHQWLSVGFTHIARSNGEVRRAVRSFQRGYWDAGGVDTPIVALIRAHQPRYPFGPAIYYSTDLERQSESTGNANFYYWIDSKAASWRMQGMPAGYFVADTVLSELSAATRPSSWLVYVDNLGLTSLKASERARLEAIAPIATDENFKTLCPLVFEGDSLGGFAFIDQKGSVIVVVSNSSEKTVSGALKFARVENGSFSVKELLGTSTGTLSIASNTGSYPIQIEGRDTKVFEIPALRELGRGGSQTSVSRRPRGTGSIGARSDEPRVDAQGRLKGSDATFRWSAPAP